MNRIFTLLSFVFLGGFAFSQLITVTLQVDITNYLADGNTLNPNGIRVGGNFATTGATVSAGAMADWTPSDPNSAMTDMGNGLWSIDVMYDPAAFGQEQLYKFVNGDWGTNEGTDTSAIADGGCGVDDGQGNINRVLMIPQADTAFTFCWDRCEPCNAGIEENVFGKVTVAPNPVDSELNISFDSNNGHLTTLSLFDMTGKKVISHTIPHMATSSTIDMSAVLSGVYIYSLSSEAGTVQGRVIKK